MTPDASDRPAGPAGATRHSPLRRPPSSRRDHSFFHTHVRIFLGVLASMALFFLLVLFIAKKTWQMKESAQMKAVSANVPPARQPGLSRMTRTTETAAAHLAEGLPDSDRIGEALLLTRRAELLQSAGQVNQAIEVYEQALKLWPTLNTARSELGQLYIRQGEFGKALPILEAAVGYEPDAPELLNDLGVVYLYQKRPQKALELLEAATRFEPQYAPAYFNKALCHLLRTDRLSARQALERYLELAPDDPKALKEIAFLEAAEGRYEEAHLTLQKALAAEPDWPPLLFDAAATAALLGNLEQTRSYLEKAESVAPPAVLLRAFRGAAFREARKTGFGKEFEARLAEKARAPSLAEAPTDPALVGNQPLLSTRRAPPQQESP